MTKPKTTENVIWSVCNCGYTEGLSIFDICSRCKLSIVPMIPQSKYLELEKDLNIAQEALKYAIGEFDYIRRFTSTDGHNSDPSCAYCEIKRMAEKALSKLQTKDSK